MYHNLDLASENELSSFGRLVKRVEEFSAYRAELVIFSSVGRAEIFGREVQLQREPLVVMNCQRRDTREPKTGELQTLLRAEGRKFERLVVRLGAMGPGHGIEATIQSVPEWKGDWGLVMAGVPLNRTCRKLQDQIGALGLEKQVVLLAVGALQLVVRLPVFG